MLRDPRTYGIIGCAMAVHRTLGCGFLEAVYQGALAIEFERQGIPFRREVPFPVFYHGHKLDAAYRADFVCFDEVIVELKAHQGFGLADTHQVVNYLRASGLSVGLLLNFGLGSLEHRRFAYTHKKNQSAEWQVARPDSTELQRAPVGFSAESADSHTPPLNLRAHT